MSFKLLNKQGVQALDPNQLIELIKGNGVISGLEVTLDENLTLNIASGDVIVNGTLYQLSSDSVTLDTADSTHPRKDIIWINEVGEVTYTVGVPEEISPSGSNRFDSATPSPVSLAGSNGVVLAEVFVDTNQSELVSNDIRDRRLFISNTSILEGVNSIEGDITNNKLLTNLEGSNLTIDENGNLNASTNGGNFSNIYDVTNYGAQGDGTTDDTNAIQSALTDASNNQGSVYFPPGTYLTNMIVVPSQVRLFGENRMNSIIKLNNNQNSSVIENNNKEPSYLINGFSGEDDRDFGIVIEKLGLDGNKANQSSSPHYEGIDLNGAKDCILRDLYVINPPGDCIDIEYCERITVKDCIVKNAGNAGVHFARGSGDAVSGGSRYSICENIVAIDCDTALDTVQASGGIFGEQLIIKNIWSIDCQGGRSNSIDGAISIQTNNTIVEGVFVNNASGGCGIQIGELDTSRGSRKNIILSNFYVENASTNGVWVVNNSSQCIVSNGIIKNCGTDGIRVDSECDNTRVSNVSIYDVDEAGIRVRDSNNVNVFQCLVRSNGDYGLLINSNCNGTYATINDLRDSGTDEVEDNGSGTITTAQNLT